MKSRDVRRRTGDSEAPRLTNRDYVEEVQRRAGKLTDATESDARRDGSTSLARHRNESLQREMAQIRHEAIQARRLAEGIDQRNRQGAGKKREVNMTDSPTDDRARAARPPERRGTNSAKQGSSQKSFNPLHPSMELPPEQLIRLLGLETKKIRKHNKGRKTGQTARAAKPAAAAHPAPIITRDRAATASVRKPARDDDVAYTGGGFTRLLLASLAVGVLAGIIATAYLLWPESGGTPARTADPVATPPKAPPTPAKDAAAAKSARPTATPKPVPRTTPRSPAATSTGSAGRHEDAEWRAAIEAEQLRLRAEAERRMAEQAPKSKGMHTGTGALANAPADASVPEQIVSQPVSPAAATRRETAGGTVAPATSPVRAEPGAGMQLHSAYDASTPQSAVTAVPDSIAMPPTGAETPVENRAEGATQSAEPTGSVEPDDDEGLF